MKKSEELRKQMQVVHYFKSAFEELLALREERRNEYDRAVPFRSLQTSPDPDDDLDVRQLRAQVAELSGPAGKAIDDAGLRLVVREPPVVGGRVHELNPVYGWMNGLDDAMAYIQPPDVIDCCGQAIGKLRASAEATEAQERSLAGRIARFIRFPTEVREAAGLPPNSRSGRTVFGVAAILQGALTTGLATVIGALLLKLLSLD